MRLTGYETYCLYLALKNHFTLDSYDYFKYHGKIKHVKKETYLARKDRFQFEKLARQCPNNMKEHMVANFLRDKTWVGDLLDDEAFDNTDAFVRINQSMSYTFRNEIEKLGDLNAALRIKDGQYSEVIRLLLQNEISIQTVVILNSFVNFVPIYDSKLPDDFIWSKMSFKIKRFAPFLLPEVDKKKLGQILKEHMESHIYS